MYCLKLYFLVYLLVFKIALFYHLSLALENQNLKTQGEFKKLNFPSAPRI